MTTKARITKGQSFGSNRNLWSVILFGIGLAAFLDVPYRDF
ncbi:hypothetical protein [Pseudalkalibacillus hwajinpoensis]|nr:hypothetical protein [Pseudalkalibacillus hwajinpoensis]